MPLTGPRVLPARAAGGRISRLLTGSADRLLQGLLQPPGIAFDFLSPEGELALTAADSVSWRVMKNPVTVFIGGVAAVLLELAEPRVRAGVWNNTTFRSDPLSRMQRTGLAAMITVYGARSRAEAMIAGVNRMHARITGTTETGAPYRADDPELLAWVQATASYGFLAAYHRFAQPLSADRLDAGYAEAGRAAGLYGVKDPPPTSAALDALFLRMQPRLEPSPVLDDFLAILHRTSILLPAMRPLQALMIRAAVRVLPDWTQRQLRIEERGLRPGEGAIVRSLGRLSDQMVLAAHPAVQACQRLGLARDHLFGAWPGAAAA